MIRVIIKLVEAAEAADNTLLKCIDLGGRKLACWDALLEEHVHLGEGAARRLRNAEVCVNNAAETNATLFRQSVLLSQSRCLVRDVE